MRGRRSIFALLVLVSAACVDSANLGIELENGLFFVLTLDEEGQLVGLPDGPYRGATELPPAFAIPPGHERQLLQLDEDRTRTSFPAYFARDLSEVSLVRASSELELCSEFGLLEEERRLLVPLEALAEAILVWPLEQGAAAEQQALPEGLALRFEARACQRGPRAILRPFGESEHIMPSSMRGALGRVHTLVPLGDDTLLAVGFSAVVRLRRGQAPDLSRDFLDVTSTLPLAPDPYSWAVRTAAASSEGVLLLADQRPDTSDRTNRLNEGAAVIWLTARPDSPLVLGEPLLLATPPEAEEVRLEHLLLEETGRYVAVGLHTVLTATSPSARPRLQSEEGFEGTWIFSLGELDAPMLVLANGGQVLEGDLFLGFDPERAHVIPEAHLNRLTSATRRRTGRPSLIVSADGGLLLERTAVRDWRSLGLNFPTEAQACLGTDVTCGRWRPLRRIDRVLGVPAHGGFLVGSNHCRALFWRSELDPCSSAVALGNTSIEYRENQGVRALLEHEGRVYLGAGEDEVYEVEFAYDAE